MSSERDEFERRLSGRLRAHELRVPVRGEPTMATPRFNLRRLAAAGAAVFSATAVVVGVSLLLNPSVIEPGPSTGSSPRVTPSALHSPTLTPPSSAQSPGDTPSPPPPPPSGPFALTWSRVELPGANVAIESVVRVGDRLIAAGRDGTGAAAWVSHDDGETWQRAVIDSAPVDGERTSFVDVVATDDGLVGIGWWGAIDTDQFAWVTWRSMDGGLTWVEQRADSPSSAMRTATVQGETIIGIGWNYGGTLPFDSWVALSDDAETWQQVNPDAMQRSQVNAATTAGNRIVAVGHTWGDGGGGPSTASAWLSDDTGASWRRIALEAFMSAPTSSASDIAVRDDGTLVAVGSSMEDGSNGIPTAWISTDGGATWRVENMGANGAATAVAETSRGLVAVGDSRLYNPGPVLSYTSGDGIRWSTTDPVTEEALYSLTAFGDASRVIVGLACVSQEPCPVVLYVGTVHEFDP
jgi:hypothetical protein